MTVSDSGPGQEASASPPADADELRAQIEQTRDQLGETVEQLMSKADVKSRLRASRQDLADRARPVLHDPRFAGGLATHT